MTELVSIVIPTYGRTDRLYRAIKSVLNQSYGNIEIIVVDDNTDEKISDHVREIIDSFSDKRLRLIKNRKNLGGALTRNEGIKASRGNYVAFLDDDDEYLPQKVEKQLDLFLRSGDELALVYCYCNSLKNGTVDYEFRYDYRGRCLFDAMRICIAATSQWMCKKSALESVGMFSDVPCKQDSTVIVKLLAAGYTVNRVPEVLSIYYDDDDIVRISSRGGVNVAKKRIIGVEALRDLCRSHYDKITKREQMEVEYAFACELFGFYDTVGDGEKFKGCVRCIITTHPFKKSCLRVVKKYVMQIWKL